MKIYDDYGDEPEDLFIPLPDTLQDRFYDLEMEGYLEDALFYDSLIPESVSILELGCGSGRIGRYLSGKNRRITGVDISLSMLQKGKSFNKAGLQFLAMDMTRLAFTSLFDVIVIPYNTLNLLVSRENILKCLNGCFSFLQPGGILICQLFLPTVKFIGQGKKSFQFQIFDLPEGGRLIKEILKEYQPGSSTISIEERFRYRPADTAPSADYNRVYPVAAFTPLEWQHLFTLAGLPLHTSYEDFKCTASGSSDSSCLLSICRKKADR